MSDTTFLVLFFATLIICMIVVFVELRIITGRLDAKLAAIPSGKPNPVRMCASCGEPVGSSPMIVNDTLAALVDRPEIKIRYYVCEICMAYAANALV